jgi:hypothetical protein
MKCSLLPLRDRFKGIFLTLVHECNFLQCTPERPRTNSRRSTSPMTHSVARLPYAALHASPFQLNQATTCAGLGHLRQLDSIACMAATHSTRAPSPLTILTSISKSPLPSLGQSAYSPTRPPRRSSFRGHPHTPGLHITQSIFSGSKPPAELGMRGRLTECGVDHVSRLEGVEGPWCQPFHEAIPAHALVDIGAVGEGSRLTGARVSVRACRGPSIGLLTGCPISSS